MQTKKAGARLMAAALACASVMAAAAPSATAVRRYALAENGFLALNVPPEWGERVARVDGLTPPTILLAPPAGEPFQILVTPLWGPDGKPMSPEALKRQVVNAAEKLKPQAVEKTITPVAIKGPRTAGWFFTVTDRAPKPGEFRFGVQGMVALEHLALSFTILTNEGRKDVPGQALAMLRDAKLERPAARKPAAAPAPVPDRAALRALFDAGKFAELDAELSAVQDAYRRGALPEDDAGRAFGALRTGDPDARKRFDQWVAEKPGSYAARTMRSQYLMDLAYMARGQEYAAKTSAAQFQGMDALFAAALEDVTVAMKADPFPIFAAYTVIVVAQGMGMREPAAAAVSTALALDPAAYWVRHAYMSGLRPEWGGSLPQMEYALAQWKRSLDDAHWQRLARMVEDAKWRAALEPAAKLFREKRYPDAIALYTKALDTAPTARAFAMRGASYAQLGRDQEAIADYDRALELDPDGECCSGTRSNRGRILLRTGAVDRGMADLLAAAENDDTWAVRELAVISAFGKYGRKPDYVAAVRWCERAAKQGDPLSMYCMGGLYIAGQGVPRDAAKAARWFEEAAKRNVPDAQVDYGVMLWNGQGVAQDKAQAIRWWKAAAKLGSKRASDQLESKLSTTEYFNEVTLPAWLEKAGIRSM